MIALSREHLASLRAAAEAAYPEECCGLVVGTVAAEGARASRTVASPNVAADRRRSFEIDPRVLFRCQRELRGTPERVIAAYHSHPDGRAAPSERDLAMALDPDLIWLIVAVAGGRAGAINAYRLAEGARDFLAVTVATL